MTKRLIVSALLLSAAAALPVAPASANTGCEYFPGKGITDPDVVGTACDATYGTVVRVLCGKNPGCIE